MHEFGSRRRKENDGTGNVGSRRQVNRAVVDVEDVVDRREHRPPFAGLDFVTRVPDPERALAIHGDVDQLPREQKPLLGIVPHRAPQIADDLESNEFWYKTPQEKNILLLQQSKEERQKKLKVKSKWADLSNVTFPAFNPDRFLTWFYGHTKFIYTAWFTVLTLILLLFCAVISVTHWNEIWRDTIEFYNFSNKT